MSRDWKPGDVAMVTVDDRQLFCTFYDTGYERGWFHGLGLTSQHYVAQVGDVDARPLVVIDPEDAEQVKRLLNCWEEAEATMSWEAGDEENLAAALREFANPTPPRPVWTDGDVVQHTRTQEAFVRGTPHWSAICDDEVNESVESGEYRVLRQQAVDA